MNEKKLIFVSFEPAGEQFRAYLSIEDAIFNQKDPETIAKKASIIYEDAIVRIKRQIAGIRTARASRKPITAREVWSVGDAIFSLVNNLKRTGLQIDGVYDHLTRDVGEKKKWFEKAIILRRYIPDLKLIPDSLNWGRIEKGTRKKAERLKAGLSLE